MIIEIVIVGLDLWALIVMALVDKLLDKLRVLSAEVFHGSSSVAKWIDLRSDKHSVELFLLVSVSVFLNNDTLTQMLNKFTLEGISIFDGAVSSEAGEDFVSFFVGSVELLEVLGGRFNAG